MPHPLPKVSVVIHFLNAAQYLSDAIASVQRQTFTDWELVLVDGGSEDDSVVIAQSYVGEIPQSVKVLAHRGEAKLGIFSSRIWGAKEAQAPILAHLDSDDEWHPQFLQRHYEIYQAMFGESPGMVYCPVTYWWEDPADAVKSYVQPVPPSGLHQAPDLLLEMAEMGYQKSAANSAVMIDRRLILEAATLIGTADEGVGDDQFLWSMIALKYPIFVNPEPLARYRQWRGSTCAIATQQGQVEQFRRRHLNWLMEYLPANYAGPQQQALMQQIEHMMIQEGLKPVPLSTPPDPLPLATPPLKQRLRQQLRDRLPSPLIRIFSRAYVFLRQTLPVGIRQRRRRWWARYRFATQVEPLSYLWGVDRGHSLLRYYLETQFLPEFAADIRGHCLEFQENSYTSRFGSDRVSKLDILHREPGNPQATLIADLTQPNNLQENTFDCIICTYVLHVIPQVERALTEIYRILKPGGSLLLAVPHISMCDPASGELWRFTPDGIRQLVANSFGEDAITIRAYGNSLIAAGNVRGLVAEEFTSDELIVHDPKFASTVCVRAVKR
ncbi:MAG: glycosyltransferase [Leptolyngbyaceae cyanobacterium bins.59]|nr:glycosyltransferase [Leptolyngbyaceae cyanobacterium bins.59]